MGSKKPEFLQALVCSGGIKQRLKAEGLLLIGAPLRHSERRLAAEAKNLTPQLYALALKRCPLRLSAVGGGVRQAARLYFPLR
jgi:hypothetical protein